MHCSRHLPWHRPSWSCYVISLAGHPPYATQRWHRELRTRLAAAAYIRIAPSQFDIMVKDGRLPKRSGSTPCGLGIGNGVTRLSIHYRVMRVVILEMASRLKQVGVKGGKNRGRSKPDFRHGAQGRNRTTDTAIFSRMLYQLSYLGAARIRSRERRFIVGPDSPVYTASPTFVRVRHRPTGGGAPPRQRA